MRRTVILLLSSVGLLGGCAMTHRMGPGAMSQAEMMRHCEMMSRQGGEQHSGMAQGEQAGTPSSAPAGEMSHEEMLRHCEMMRQQQQAPDAQQDAPASPH